MRRLIILVLILLVILFGFSAVSKLTGGLNLPDKNPLRVDENIKVVNEESVTINAVKKVGPSVVTITEEIPQERLRFGPFFFGDEEDNGPSNIGSGFIVSSDGYVVTNKHVVSDTGVKYEVVTSSDKKYEIKQIFRDPLNDIAIVKIDPSDNPGNNLVPVEMGDSGKLQVGQFAVAIGTALGEFRNTVTTGVISGLGRGITAGSQFQGYVEKLDNVIQTSAAINPGNSGGPLVNSSGQVIGINTAVASSGQNIGFALPINVVKETLSNFNSTGQFRRPYLGVVYKLITRDVAVLNEVPQGAYVQEVAEGSGAQDAGIERGDILTEIDGRKVTQEDDLSKIIAGKKIGDRVRVRMWRDEETINVTVELKESPNN